MAPLHYSPLFELARVLVRLDHVAGWEHIGDEIGAAGLHKRVVKCSFCGSPVESSKRKPWSIINFYVHDDLNDLALEDVHGGTALGCRKDELRDLIAAVRA